MKHRIAIIGLGYVGLPLARLFLEHGHIVYGIDVDHRKIQALLAKQSYLSDFTNKEIRKMFAGDRFHVSDSLQRVKPSEWLLIAPQIRIEFPPIDVSRSIPHELGPGAFRPRSSEFGWLAAFSLGWSTLLGMTTRQRHRGRVFFYRARGGRHRVMPCSSGSPGQTDQRAGNAWLHSAKARSRPRGVRASRCIWPGPSSTTVLIRESPLHLLAMM